MSDETKFTSAFGIPEEAYVRAAEKGNYNPEVHELHDLIIENKLTLTEVRILYFINRHTTNFRETEKRFRRSDIYEALNIDRKNFELARKSLLNQGYLLEKKDKYGYYYYGLNPFKFNGLIVLKNIKDSISQINRSTKVRLGISCGKSPRNTWLKATKYVGKYHPEDEVSIRNLSEIEILKYTLLKYTLLNGLSALAGERIFTILSEANNPAYMVLQFVKLMNADPKYSKGMYLELQRAHQSQTDCDGNRIKTIAAAYFITCWEKARVHWQNLNHVVDMSDETVAIRNELYDVIQSFPLNNNVVPMKVIAQ